MVFILLKIVGLKQRRRAPVGTLPRPSVERLMLLCGIANCFLMKR
jgi:hypothetical protein